MINIASASVKGDLIFCVLSVGRMAFYCKTGTFDSKSRKNKRKFFLKPSSFSEKSSTQTLQLLDERAPGLVKTIWRTEMMRSG